MKRNVLLLIFISILAFVFNGCGGNTKLNNNTDISASKTKLTLLFYYEGQERFAIINNLCNTFNKEHKEIEMVPEFVPHEFYNRKVATGYTSGSLPEVMIYDKSSLAYFADMGILDDISDLLDNSIYKKVLFKNSIESCTYKGQIYGIPIGENCLELFYNKKLLKDKNLNPPDTWDELKKTAKILTAGNIKGIGVSAQDSEEGMFQFLPLLYSTGSNISNLNSNDLRRALALLTDLVKEGSMSREVINWSQADVMKQFADEKIAMMINGSWQIPELKIKSPELEYGVSRIPRDMFFTTVLGGENIGVTKGNKGSAASEFVSFLLRRDESKKFLKAMGYIPSRNDIDINEVLPENNQLKVFTQEIKNAIPREKSTRWPEISSVITKALRSSLTQVETPGKAAEEAAVKIRTIIK